MPLGTSASLLETIKSWDGCLALAGSIHMSRQNGHPGGWLPFSGGFASWRGRASATQTLLWQATPRHSTATLQLKWLEDVGSACPTSHGCRSLAIRICPGHQWSANGHQSTVESKLSKSSKKQRCPSSDARSPQ